jgi:hypothetical protein
LKGGGAKAGGGRDKIEELPGAKRMRKILGAES